MERVTTSSGRPAEKTFAREEIMLPVKCNQHPWMRDVVNVTRSRSTRSRTRRQVRNQGLPPAITPLHSSMKS